MKIISVTIRNFRGYEKATTIDFNDLTVFIGKNDVGKSTILEALDLFFNEGKGTIKMEKTDLCVDSNDKDFEISVEFGDLPQNVVLDSQYQTSLEEEYLLNDRHNLVVNKVFNGSKCTGTFINAKHPTNPLCSDLHSKKKSELQKIIKEHNIACDNLNVNAVMRTSIWNHCDDLQLDYISIDVNSGDDTKHIWESLSKTLPSYSLFRADRPNSDNDKEVQDPLKMAVNQFFQDASIQDTLKSVAELVERKLREVSERTLDKLREMDSSIADSLNPVIPTSESLKWADVFTKSVSITSDDNIPINKRGSGVKRLILLNFFRAEAERRLEQGDSTGIIYAIEEPETSQHFANQKILVKAFQDLSKAPNTQVILTTHSGIIVKELDCDDIRLVSCESGKKTIQPIKPGVLGYTSLNEINYIAFNEITEEYHDELYGYIESNHWLTEYESGKSQMKYIFEKDGKTKESSRTLTHYIRDVHHHPENTNNAKYTMEQLATSLKDMITFIESKRRINI